MRARPRAGRTKPGSASWRRGDVDADRQPGAARAAARQLGELRARGLAAPSAPSGTISPVSSAIGTNSAGSTAPPRRRASGRAPRSRRCGRSPPARSAGRRPRARARSIARRRSRLEVEPAHHLLVHRRVEHRVAALAVGLRAVHRDVGVAHHVLRRGVGGRRARCRCDASTNSSRPSSSNGVCERCVHALGDRPSPRARRATSSSSSVNSSPPRRATVSSGRSAASSRCATAISSWSPTWWPSESLTTLKRSRSRNSTAAQRLGLAALGAADRLVEAVEEQHAVRAGR